MKNYLLYGIIILMTSCVSQLHIVTSDNSKIGIKSNKIRGTIFKKKYSYNLEFAFVEDTSLRWTPSIEEIQLAESILQSNIRQVNHGHINQVDNCPIIHKNLNNYFRQYVGIINEKGEKLIHINFSWDKYGIIDRIKGYSDRRLTYDSNYNVVFDGCSYFWQVTVNLDQKKLKNFMVNGIA